MEKAVFNHGENAIFTSGGSTEAYGRQRILYEVHDEKQTGRQSSDCAVDRSRLQRTVIETRVNLSTYSVEDEALDSRGKRSCARVQTKANPFLTLNVSVFGSTLYPYDDTTSCLQCQKYL